MCVTAEEEELALRWLMIGECLLTPQNRRSPFSGPGWTLRSLSTGPCCVTTHHLCSLAVPPSPNCSAILLPTGLKKQQPSFCLRFARTTGRRRRPPFSSPYLSVRSCSFKGPFLTEREEEWEHVLVGVFWRCWSRVSVRTEEVCWDLYSSDAQRGFHTAPHCCCSQPLHGTIGLSTEPAGMGEPARGLLKAAMK